MKKLILPLTLLSSTFALVLRAETPPTQAPQAPRVLEDSSFSVEEIDDAKLANKQTTVKVTDRDEKVTLQSHTLLQLPHSEDFEIKDALLELQKEDAKNPDKTKWKTAKINEEVFKLDTFRMKQFAVDFNKQDYSHETVEGKDAYTLPFSARVRINRVTFNLYGHLRVIMPDGCAAGSLACTMVSKMEWILFPLGHDKGTGDFSRAKDALNVALPVFFAEKLGFSPDDTFDIKQRVLQGLSASQSGTSMVNAYNEHDSDMLKIQKMKADAAAKPSATPAPTTVIVPPAKN